MTTWLLVIAALAQVGYLGASAARAPDRPQGSFPTILIGDTIRELVGGKGGVRDTLSLVGDRWTVVMAYNSQCVHCETVAPAWAEWLPGPDWLTPVGLTTDPVDIASAYESAHGWALNSFPIDQDFDRIEGYLVSRTPWLFLFDPAGQLVYQGHGSRLDELEAVALEHQGRS